MLDLILFAYLGLEHLLPVHRQLVRLHFAGGHEFAPFDQVRWLLRFLHAFRQNVAQLKNTFGFELGFQSLLFKFEAFLLVGHLVGAQLVEVRGVEVVISVR